LRPAFRERKTVQSKQKRARRKSAASDQATRNIRRKNAELAIRVRVAASGLTDCEERVFRPRSGRVQQAASVLVTECRAARILGTDSGQRDPRPSSRETAMPPHWVSDRGGTVAIKPSVWNGSPLSFHAERTEAGPGPGAGCQQNRFDARNLAGASRLRRPMR